MHTQRVASHESAHGIDPAPVLDVAIDLSIFFGIYDITFNTTE